MDFRFNVRCSRTANIKSAAKVLLFCYKQMNLYFFHKSVMFAVRELRTLRLLRQDVFVPVGTGEDGLGV